MSFGSAQYGTSTCARHGLRCEHQCPIGRDGFKHPMSCYLNLEAKFGRKKNPMSEQKQPADGPIDNQQPVEHDNRYLIPYLKAVAEAEDRGENLETTDTDDLFQKIYSENADEETPEFPGASKIRQTFYIAKLARKVGTTLALTAAGRELIGE